MRRPIVLSGFMASGKTTVGRRLASSLGVPFVDTDALLVEEAGAEIHEIWRREGEVGFRAREAALAERLLADPTPRVIAFGGGAVTNRRTRHKALEVALVITLAVRPETVTARVEDLAGRPNLGSVDPTTRAADLLEQRREAYAEAHATIATDDLDPDAVVEAILAVVRRDPLAVPLGSRSYRVDVGRDDPALLTDAIASLSPSSLVVVTDANVERARHGALAAALGKLAVRETHVTLPAGEAHKTLASVGTIWDAALGAGLDRDAVVVAFGGGVVGDLGGFAASALLRGIRFVQVPTTLLAMVDASVGGKTGFDHPVGKNLLGAFHQPSAVVADVGHLATLPARERTAGLAEIVKIGLACDAELLERVEAAAPALARGDADALLPIVRAAILAKIRVVRDDERETGARALLNLGHTIGHALEAHGAYARWLHGEAVAIGTVLELAATTALGWTPRDLGARATSLLGRLGLPVAVSPAELTASWPFVSADKKRARDVIKLPVVTAAGEARVERVGLDVLRRAVVGTP